jgi:hypothetical protein
LVPLVGHAATISAGEYVHAVGVWLTDRTHGLQFKADVLKTTPHTTTEGMARYLGSGMVRGIGPKLADRIVGQFGLDTFEVIEADAGRLREVPGIGEFRATRIASGWAEQKAVRDIIVFLHPARCDDASTRCSASNRLDQRNASCLCTPPSTTLSTSSVILHPATRSASSEAKRSRRGERLRRPEPEPKRLTF